MINTEMFQNKLRAHHAYVVSPVRRGELPLLVEFCGETDPNIITKDGGVLLEKIHFYVGKGYLYNNRVLAHGGKGFVEEGLLRGVPYDERHGDEI